MDEKNFQYYKEKADKCYAQAKYDEALTYYEKCKETKPNDYKILGNIGLIHLKKKELNFAKNSLNSAIKLNPNYTKAHYRLGLIFKEEGMVYEALSQFEKVLTLEPNNKEAKKEYNEVKILKKKKKNKIVLPKIDNLFKLPETLPKTSYQFNLIWKEIKTDEMKIDYLEFIGSENFFQLFKKNLEPDFFSELIYLFSKMNKESVFNFLNCITKIETFEFNKMFLSKNEKQMLKQTIETLDQQIICNEKNVLLKSYSL